MAKVNIRESLGRIDLLTDNKYDLRNTYDSSNISNDKKKKLAESISNNASAKQLHDILNEGYYDSPESLLKTIEKSAKDVALRDGYDQIVAIDTDGEYYFHRDYPSHEYFDGQKPFERVKVVYKNGVKDTEIEKIDESLNEEDGFDSDEYERKHILRLAKSVEEASKRKGMNISNLKKTAKRYIENHKDTKNKKELDKLIKAYKSLDEKEECLEEDTVKQNGKWVNKGKEGTHGKFKTKKAADAQRKAMFANGYKAEALKEANYGGAYDIEDDMFFTKDEIVELADEVCGLLHEKFGYDYEVVEVGMESTTELYLCIQDIHGVEEESTFRIDMRKIRKPSDLFKYAKPIASRLAEKFEEEYQYYDFDESLKEGFGEVSGDFAFARKNWDKLETGVSFDDALEEYNKQFGEEYFYAKPIYVKSAWDKMVSMFTESLKEAVEDEVDFDEYEETDFNDGEVEHGDTFIEDGREWTWIERIAGPIHLDFDNWAVWSARDYDYIQEKIKPYITDKGNLTIDVLTKIYDEAEVAYFVVDEDTGFIDWGPVESQTEAQDFLNGKVEDWENDEYDESLKESKQLKESYGLELEYEDIDGDGSSYTYEVDEDKVLDYLRDRDDYPEEIGNLPDDEFQAWFKTKEYDEWLEDNLYELFEKHYDDLLDYFEEDAQTEYFDRHGDEYLQDRETGSWYRR